MSEKDPGAGQRRPPRCVQWIANHPFLAAAAFFLAGIVFWGGFNTAIEATNTQAFCISCHEMRDYVYPEYRQTAHFSNPRGVRATCADCHVPKEWHHKVVRKISATNELYHKVIGSVDTREKFEARRLKLAGYVWDSMRASDSRECRNCHSFSAMELEGQSGLAAQKHRRAEREGRTCIDCHLGVAHAIPRNFDADGKLHARFKAQDRPCSDCHTGMARPPD